jgi:hypothetical protein
MLACFLLTRSLIETIALFDAFERRLFELFDQGDIGGMDVLVMKQALPGNDFKLEIDDGARGRTIMGAVDELEHRHKLPVRENYVRLVERCDPCRVAQYPLHTTVDKPSGPVIFSEAKDLAANSERLLLALSLLLVFEGSLNALDDIIRQTPEVHKRRRRV